MSVNNYAQKYTKYDPGFQFHYERPYNKPYCACAFECKEKEIAILPLRNGSKRFPLRSKRNGRLHPSVSRTSIHLGQLEASTFHGLFLHILDERIRALARTAHPESFRNDYFLQIVLEKRITIFIMRYVKYDLYWHCNPVRFLRLISIARLVVQVEGRNWGRQHTYWEPITILSYIPPSCVLSLQLCRDTVPIHYPPEISLAINLLPNRNKKDQEPGEHRNHGSCYAKWSSMRSFPNRV